MRIDIDIKRLVPRFLYNDKNGYALCKAIERAFQIVAEESERGIEIIHDPDKMPEWRLDEMAWELNCLYDYSADIESKRHWIKNAIYLYEVYGTPQALYNFLSGVFRDVEVQEFWEYDGEPYHFRINARGSGYKISDFEWASKAIEYVKNVRSVLDAIKITEEVRNEPLTAGSALAVDRAKVTSHYPYGEGKVMRQSVRAASAMAVNRAKLVIG